MNRNQQKAFWSKKKLESIIDFRDFHTDGHGLYGIAVDRDDVNSIKETLLDNRFKKIKVDHADDYTSVLRFKQ